MASKYKEIFTSPGGRIVQGDVFEMQTKDNTGALRVVKTGPNAGQPSPQIFIALAFPKGGPGWQLEHEMTQPNPRDGQPGTDFGRFYSILDKVARISWPQFFPQPAPAPCVRPGFAMKVKDGDGLDQNGKPNSAKEGFAGHWIVSFASSFLPKVVRPNGPGVWEAVTNKNAIKRGYYVRIAGNASSNESMSTPGIYVNVDMVELVGYGAEIVGGIDAATAFSGGPAPLPVGASAVPLAGPGLAHPGAPPAAPGAPAAYAPPPLPGAPAAYVPPAVPGAPAAYAPPPVAPVAPAAYAPPPVAPVAPVVPNMTYMAPPPVAPLAPPPPVGLAGHTMTAAAGGMTREQFLAQGWTDDLLMQHGYMVG